jgi:PAS domain S-box-containing protein
MKIVMTHGEDRFVSRHRRKDGSSFDIEVSVQYQPIEDGRFVVFIEDITERKYASNQLKLEAELLDAATDSIFLHTFEGEFVYFNEAAYKQRGYTREELKGMNLTQLDAPWARELFAPRVKEIEKYGEATFETAHLCKDGRKIPVEAHVRVIEAAGRTMLLSITRDITERKRAEESLRENEIIFSSFLEHSPVYVFFKDENIRALKLSKNFETMIGKPLVELLGKNMNELFPSELAQAMIAVDRSILAKGEVVKVIEEMNGRTYETTKFPIFKDNRPMMLAGFTVDITERKQAEEQVKASLKEKETLLKEIHHRVKNNMQVISSLLQLQSNFVKDKEDARLFQASQERIKSMSLVYNKLYQSKNLAEVSLKEYMTELVENLMRSYNTGTNVTTRMDIDAIVLGLDLVIPCGLIVNEIVTNSLKYAFRDGRTGLISISAHKSGADALEMKIADNGVGLPENVNVNSSQTLGMMLIYTLAQEQLDGTIEINRSNGTEYTIIFRAYPSKEANHEGD